LNENTQAKPAELKPDHPAGDKIGVWRTFENGIKRVATALAPAASWVGLLSCLYLAVGIVLYPIWWKRFLFQGGWHEAQYLKFAVWYLGELVSIMHPVGLLLVAMVFFLLASVFHLVSRHGLRNALGQLTFPPKALVWLGVIALFFSLIGLRGVQETYRTPEEAVKIYTKLREELETPFHEFGRSGYGYPSSGFFFYLDSERVAKAYGLLQQQMRVASETTKQSSEGTLGLGAGIGGFKVDSAGKLVEEKVLTKTPVAETPERQAQELIATLSRKLEPIFEEQSNSASKIYVLRTVLKQHGVDLTKEQENSIREAEIIKYKLALSEKPRSVVRYRGTIRIKSAKAGFEFECSQKVNLEAKWFGELDGRFLDPTIRKLLSGTTNEFSSEVWLLGIAFKSESKGNVLEIHTVPIAIW
jgi:hypothetical protein